MPDYSANPANIEHLLDKLGIPAPPAVQRSRALLTAVGELDVVNRPPLSNAQLASRALAMLRDGQDVDLVALVSENAALGVTGEADRLLRAVQSDAEIAHEQAIRGAARGLLPDVRTETEKVIEQVRRLPQGTPTRSEAAVDGGQAAVMAYQALKVLGERHGQLRALHAELVAGTVDMTAFAWYRDTKCQPTFATGRAETAGPSEPLARLRWLTTPEAQAWVPSGPECTSHYLAISQERNKPRTPATVQA